MYEIAGRATRRCPISRFKVPAVQTALQLYGAYKKGHLPSPGCFDAQTALFCETMFLCENLEAQAANWDMNQTKQKAERARKSRNKKGR